jgi:general L-amino acid transport system permease protein
MLALIVASRYRLSFAIAGILLALGRQSHLFIVNKICVTFIRVIRGVPLIVWLFTGSLNYFLPPGTNFDLLLRDHYVVTLFAAAYIMIMHWRPHAAVLAVRAQVHLGLSTGPFTRLIVLPRAISIPGIVNTFIGVRDRSRGGLSACPIHPVRFRPDPPTQLERHLQNCLLARCSTYSASPWAAIPLHLEEKLQREHRWGDQQCLTQQPRAQLIATR